MVCVDVNECEEGISGCQQYCNNTIGSYYCGCQSGYHLGEDGHMCEGEYYFLVRNTGLLVLYPFVVP